MEKLAASGLIAAAIDITTTEVCDLLVGGVFPCLPTTTSMRSRGPGIPYVGSVGALDMVNFGARDSVPERFRGRTLYVHNAQVTLMRTTAAENARDGRLDRRQAQPHGRPGALPAAARRGLGDRRARRAVPRPRRRPALFEAIRAGFRPGPDRRLIEVGAAINDAAFAAAAVAAFREIAG